MSGSTEDASAEWQNAKSKYSSDRDFIGFLTTVNSFDWIRGKYPNIDLVKEVVNLIVDVLMDTPRYHDNKRIKRKVLQMFHPDVVKASSKETYELYGELFKKFSEYFTKERLASPTSYSRKADALKHDVDSLFIEYARKTGRTRRRAA